MSNHIQQAKGFLRTAEKYDAEHTAAIEKAGEKYEQSMRSAGASLFAAIQEEAAELGLGAPPTGVYAGFVKWRRGKGRELTGYAAGLREQGISPESAQRALTWHLDADAARAERSAETARLALVNAKAAKLLAARQKAAAPSLNPDSTTGPTPARTGVAVKGEGVGKTERDVAKAERADSETTIFDPSLTDTQARAITLLRAMGEWVRANDDADVAAAMLLWQQSVVG